MQLYPSYSCSAPPMLYQTLLYAILTRPFVSFALNAFLPMPAYMPSLLFHRFIRGTPQSTIHKPLNTATTPSPPPPPPHTYSPNPPSFRSAAQQTYSAVSRNPLRRAQAAPRRAHWGLRAWPRGPTRSLRRGSRGARLRDRGCVLVWGVWVS